MTADGTVLLAEMAGTTHYGRVCEDAAGYVSCVDEQGETSGPGWISAGVYLLKFLLFQTIPISKSVSLERVMFPAWIRRGLYAYHSQGRFLDIGTPEAYARDEAFYELPRSLRKIIL